MLQLVCEAYLDFRQFLVLGLMYLERFLLGGLGDTPFYWCSAVDNKLSEAISGLGAWFRVIFCIKMLGLRLTM